MRCSKDVEIVFITPLWICKTEKKLVLLTVKTRKYSSIAFSQNKALREESVMEGSVGER